MSDSQKLCFHCSTPVPSGVNIELAIKGKQESFCCPACRAVTQTILGSGLDQYYKHRDNANGERPTSQENENQLSLYDSDAVQSQFVRTLADGTKEATFVIEGIHCAACVWLLEKHIGSQPGAVSFNVNLTNHRARLIWHPEQSPLSELMKSIQSIGYTPHPYHPNQEEQLYQQEKRRAIYRLGIAGVGMMQVMMMAAALYLGAAYVMEENIQTFIRWTSFIVATPVVLYAARPFFTAALRDIRTRHLSMDVPVSIAVGGAYLASIWATFTRSGEVYYDSVSMFTFFLLIGRFFEMQARHRTGMAGNELANLLPASATRIDAKGETLVPVSELKPGDRVLVKPGHSIPADGILFTAHTSIDESALTGESLPVSKRLGDAVVGGTMNVEQAIEVEITSGADQSRMTAILNLLDRAQADKPKVAMIADRVASYFVAGVLITALAVGITWWQIKPEDAFWITLSVLVVTCPCALSLATPTALTAAIGTLRKIGLLVTRGHVLESLASSTSVYFDKTGTLTTGQLSLRATHSLNGESIEDLTRLAAAVESRSEHPIASAFTPFFEVAADSATNFVGEGIEGALHGRTVRIGKPAFAAQIYPGEAPAHPDETGIWLLMSDASGPIAWFVIDDQLRPEAVDAVKQLQSLGLKVGMLTGDQPANAARIAQELGIDHFEANLAPESKLERVKALQAGGEKILMVGDGINDIPVLTGAQTSIAMNGATDLAKTSADAVLVSSDLLRIPQAIKLARKTGNIIRQNIGWALIYNLIALPLAATGFIAPWMAAIGMSASSLVVVGNALRLISQK